MLPGKIIEKKDNDKAQFFRVTAKDQERSAFRIVEKFFILSINYRHNT